MTDHRALVLVDGAPVQLPDGDRLVGAGGIAPLTVAGTALTLTAEDHDGKRLVFTSDDTVAVTAPAGLGDRFHCEIVPAGAGVVALYGGGATLRAPDDLTAFETPWTLGRLAAIGGDQLVVAGADAASPWLAGAFWFDFPEASGLLLISGLLA